MKRCVVCKANVSFEQFNAKRSSSDGLQNVCRSCNRASARAYYARSREKHLAVIRRRTIAARKAALQLVGEYLQLHPCVDCGEDDIRVLDFDHLPGTVKTHEVMRLVRNGHSKRRILDEIAKCQVRCRNCHAIVTYARAGGTWRSQFNDPRR